jgi:hypothetical protein
MSASDELTEETKERVIKNNEAGRAMWGSSWATCTRTAKRTPRATPPASKPPAEEPKTS